MEVIKLMGQPDNIRDITKDKSEWNYSLYMTPFVKSSTIVWGDYESSCHSRRQRFAHRNPSI